MSVLDIVRGPWDVRPEVLLEVAAIYRAHATGGGVETNGAARPRPRPRSRRPWCHMSRSMSVAVRRVSFAVCSRVVPCRGDVLPGGGV